MEKQVLGKVGGDNLLWSGQRYAPKVSHSQSEIWPTKMTLHDCLFETNN